MIKIPNESASEHFNKVVAFAKKHNILPQLIRRLEWLGRYACYKADEEGQPEQHTECHLYPDFAPMSFSFVMFLSRNGSPMEHWFNGGLVYAGPLDDGTESKLDGSAPTFTVGIGTPEVGWSVHT